jgi:hypothetical protein
MRPRNVALFIFLLACRGFSNFLVVVVADFHLNSGEQIGGVILADTGMPTNPRVPAIFLKITTTYVQDSFGSAHVCWHDVSYVYRRFVA